MTKNSKTLTTILIVVIIASALLLVYYFFLRPEGGSSVVGEGLVHESASAEIDSFTNFESLSSQTGRELLSLLDDLRSISFDSGFIQNTAFSNLEDFSRPLEPQTPGRENPFAPLQ
ncbi:MAG: hypothetical protein WDZ74_00665 [Candidatus Paceibacterota bacterium]